ncbi:hypothetical protein HZH68_015681 [Vespula germanica]|uniref:Uncharacterized protein n=1 Tax=Vespula germanica TaxID=30212 RepID=A0A834J4K3_VESGE|nr:hypothetical protein HZH68_015681 [Vespula germanica]
MGPFIELPQTETRASCLLDGKYNLVRDLTVRNSVRPPFRCSNVEHSTIIPIRMASLFRSRQQRNDERRLTVHHNSSYSKWEIRKVLLAEFSGPLLCAINTPGNKTYRSSAYSIRMLAGYVLSPLYPFTPGAGTNVPTSSGNKLISCLARRQGPRDCYDTKGVLHSFKKIPRVRLDLIGGLKPIKGYDITDSRQLDSVTGY